MVVTGHDGGDGYGGDGDGDDQWQLLLICAGLRRRSTQGRGCTVN